MEDGKYVVIAIDGGAASGKSTTARGLAKELNFMHVDTGMHFRGLTAELLRHEIDLRDSKSVENAIHSMVIDTVLKDNEAHMTINGVLQDQNLLKSKEVTANVSLVAVVAGLRHYLSKYQRSLVPLGKAAKFQGIIMEGRDIGSVILQDANFKFFMEASLQVREERRLKEGKADIIEKRDKADSARKVAPLTCAHDAVRIDTTNLSIEEVLELIKNIINKEK